MRKQKVGGLLMKNDVQEYCEREWNILQYVNIESSPPLQIEVH